jgi:hypothetical protein
MSRFNLPTSAKTAAEELPPVDPDALREFAAGAKEHRTEQPPPPWEAFDPEAIPKHNASVRLNDYQLAMLRFVAERTDVSQQKVLNRILIPAIEEQATKLYEG